MSATYGDLRDAIKDTLEQRGYLKKLKAQLRAEIYHSLEDPLEPKLNPSEENAIINELIREYLEFNNYKHTLSVFVAEANHATTSAWLDRHFISTKLGVERSEIEEQTKVPLLYNFVLTRAKNRVLEHGDKNPPLKPFRSPRKNRDHKGSDVELGYIASSESLSASTSSQVKEVKNSYPDHIN